MNPISITGAFIITIALLSYGIGSISLQRFKMLSPGVLWFLSIGVILDITATIFMIIGSKNILFTLHGCIGLSALLAMLIDLILIWRVYSKEGFNVFVSKKLQLYSKFAFGWWVIAYIIGSILVIWR